MNLRLSLKQSAHYFNLVRSLLRVPTYLLLIMYLFVGIFTGIAVEGLKPTISQLIIMLLKAAVCALIIALWYINGTALNDYADYEIDIINLKGDQDRPLVVGTATSPELLKVAFICGGLAVVSAGLLQWRFGVLLLFLLLLNISYSIRPLQISRRGGLAPILLPIGYVVLPVYLGYGLNANHWERLASVMIIGFYLQFIGRIILKDYRDVKGDKQNGKMTFLLRHGNKMVCIISALAIMASSIWLIYFAGLYLRTFRYTIICLLGFGLVTLYQLSQVSKWRKQKPIIAAFGRSMTGITAAVITGLIVYIWPLRPITALSMAIILMLVYIWSAQQAFSYNVSLLSKQ